MRSTGSETWVVPSIGKPGIVSDDLAGHARSIASSASDRDLSALERCRSARDAGASPPRAGLESQTWQARLAALIEQRQQCKAAVIYENGSPDVLRYEDVADPECPDGCVVIDVEAISIEGGDLLARAGSPPPSVPHIVGYLAAGTVAECGAGVEDRAVGDRVGDPEHGRARTPPSAPSRR